MAGLLHIDISSCTQHATQNVACIHHDCTCFHYVNELVTTVRFGVLLLAGRVLMALLLPLHGLRIDEGLHCQHHLPQRIQKLHSTGNSWHVSVSAAHPFGCWYLLAGQFLQLLFLLNKISRVLMVLYHH